MIYYRKHIQYIFSVLVAILLSGCIPGLPFMSEKCFPALSIDDLKDGRLVMDVTDVMVVAASGTNEQREISVRDLDDNLITVMVPVSSNKTPRWVSKKDAQVVVSKNKKYKITINKIDGRYLKPGGVFMEPPNGDYNNAIITGEFDLGTNTYLGKRVIVPYITSSGELKKIRPKNMEECIPVEKGDEIQFTILPHGSKVYLDNTKSEQIISKISPSSSLCYSEMMKKELEFLGMNLEGDWEKVEAICRQRVLRQLAYTLDGSKFWKILGDSNYSKFRFKTSDSINPDVAAKSEIGYLYTHSLVSPAEYVFLGEEVNGKWVRKVGNDEESWEKFEDTDRAFQDYTQTKSIIAQDKGCLTLLHNMNQDYVDANVIVFVKKPGKVVIHRDNKGIEEKEDEGIATGKLDMKIIKCDEDDPLSYKCDPNISSFSEGINAMTFQDVTAENENGYILDKWEGTGQLWFKIGGEDANIRGLQGDFNVNYTAKANAGYMERLYGPIIEVITKVSYKTFENAYTTIVQNSRLHLIIKIALVIWVALRASGFIMGTAKITAYEFTIDIIKFGIIFSLFTKTVYQDSIGKWIFDVMSNLPGFLIEAARPDKQLTDYARASGIFWFVDDIFAIIFNQELLQRILLLLFTPGGILVVIILLVAYWYIIIGFIQAFVVYIFSIVMLCVALALMPFFIPCMLFSFLKETFEKYTQVLIRIAIEPSIVIIGLSIISSIIIVLFKQYFMNMILCFKCMFPIADMVGLTDTFLSHIPLISELLYVLCFWGFMPWGVDNFGSGGSGFFFLILQYMVPGIGILMLAALFEKYVGFAGDLTRSLTQIFFSGGMGNIGGRGNRAGGALGAAGILVDNMKKFRDYVGDSIDKKIKGALRPGIKPDQIERSKIDKFSNDQKAALNNRDKLKDSKIKDPNLQDDLIAKIQGRKKLDDSDNKDPLNEKTADLMKEIDRIKGLKGENILSDKHVTLSEARSLVQDTLKDLNAERKGIEKEIKDLMQSYSPDVDDQLKEKLASYHTNLNNTRSLYNKLDELNKAEQDYILSEPIVQGEGSPVQENIPQGQPQPNDESDHGNKQPSIDQEQARYESSSQGQPQYDDQQERDHSYKQEQHSDQHEGYQSSGGYNDDNYNNQYSESESRDNTWTNYYEKFDEYNDDLKGALEQDDIEKLKEIAEEIKNEQIKFNEPIKTMYDNIIDKEGSALTELEDAMFEWLNNEKELNEAAFKEKCADLCRQYKIDYTKVEEGLWNKLSAIYLK